MVKTKKVKVSLELIPISFFRLIISMFAQLNKKMMMLVVRKFLFIALAGMVFLSCNEANKTTSNTVEPSNDTELAVNLQKISLNIEGMTCEIGCAKTIESKLSKAEGVTMASISFDKKQGIVEFDANKTTTKKITAVVEKIAGGDLYEVTETKEIETDSDE